MGNGTEATTILLGGSLVTVLLFFFGPELAAWRGAPTPEQVAGMTTLAVFILALVLPDNLLERVKTRTRKRRPAG